MYQPRRYRNLVKASDLVRFTVSVEETDLLILANRALPIKELEAEAHRLVRIARAQLREHIAEHPAFLSSMVPLPLPGADDANAEDVVEFIAAMYDAGQQAGTGPMAAVAGAVAQFVGLELLGSSQQIIVENGGDIFIKSDMPRTIGIHAGSSPLSGKVGVRLPAGTYGVATSSATVGHSFSAGRADAAMVISGNTVLADAVATELCNRVKRPDDIQPALQWVQQIRGVLHAAVIMEDRFGTWGQFEIVPTAEADN
jgi:uncharacterized protein